MNKKVFLLQIIFLGVSVVVQAQETIEPDDAVTTRHLDDEGQVVQPYGIHDNPFSVLDVADIVYICPVNTGFSRIIKGNKEGTDVSSQGASRGNRQNASSKGS